MSANQNQMKKIFNNIYAEIILYILLKQKLLKGERYILKTKKKCKKDKNINLKWNMIFIYTLYYIYMMTRWKKMMKTMKNIKLYVCLSRVALYLKSKSNISVNISIYDWSWFAFDEINQIKSTTLLNEKELWKNT